MTQRVAITGSSGLIGGALSSFLTERGDTVLRLVRREPSDPLEVRWDPAAGELDPAALEGVDAVVNLAGAGIGDKRWSDEYKQTLLRSRVDSTTTIATALAKAAPGARLVSGSAMGAYGDCGETDLDESSPIGEGFLADLVAQWEAATEPATAAGCPTAFARTGLVMTGDGGAFGRMMPLARLGLGGPLGSGRQWWAWISLNDQVRALVHLIDHPEVTGPANIVSPDPRRQRDIASALGKALHRPAVLPAPAFALRAVLGEFAQDILASAKVHPRTLTESGFRWDQPDLDAGIAWLLERDS
ncbi:TIGR01777 family oxidoreductase [Dermacoccaceae bacterium W4C1]